MTGSINLMLLEMNNRRGRAIKEDGEGQNSPHKPCGRPPEVPRRVTGVPREWIRGAGRYKSDEAQGLALSAQAQGSNSE